MTTYAWLRFLGPIATSVRAQVTALLERAGIVLGAASLPQPTGLGVAAFEQPEHNVLEELQQLTKDSRVLAVSVGPARLDPKAMWAVLHAGAADLLLWPTLPVEADDVACRLERWAGHRRTGRLGASTRAGGRSERGLRPNHRRHDTDHDHPSTRRSGE